MSNLWHSILALQGSKEEIHKFIQLGLRNSDLKSSDDFFKDLKLLAQKGKTKLGVDAYGFEGNRKQAAEITYENRLSLRTFLPMPDTFHKYDTSTHPDIFPKAAKEQQKKYGVVGWRDYNIKTIGVETNCYLNLFSDIETCVNQNKFSNMKYFNDTDNRYILSFITNYTPDNWCLTIKKMFPELGVFIQSRDECDEKCICGKYTEFRFVPRKNGSIHYTTYNGHRYGCEFEEYRDELRDDIFGDVDEDSDEFYEKDEEFYEELENRLTNDFNAMLDEDWESNDGDDEDECVIDDEDDDEDEYVIDDDDDDEDECVIEDDDDDEDECVIEDDDDECDLRSKNMAKLNLFFGNGNGYDEACLTTLNSPYLATLKTPWGLIQPVTNSKSVSPLNNGHDFSFEFFA